MATVGSSTPAPAQRGASRSFLREPSRSLLGLLVAVRVAIVFIAIVAVHREVPSDADIVRFRQVAALSGRPWRDTPVEFPPGQVLLIDVLANGGPAATATAIAIVAGAADLAAAVMLAKGWGRRAAVAYLLLGLPLLPFVLLKLDFVAVVLAVGAVAQARRERHRTSGALLALGSAVRLWPVLLLPSALLAGRRRAAAWGAGLTAVLVAAWVAYGGFGAPRQVLTFRGAKGWEIGSTVGSAIWALTGGAPRVESGAFRVGAAPPWALAAVTVGLAASLFAIYRAQARSGRAPDGGIALALVAALLFWSPVLSLQYVTWLLPWAAIAWAEEDDRWALGMTGVIVLLSVLPNVLVSVVVWFRLVALARDLLLGVVVLRVALGRGAAKPIGIAG